MENLKDKSNDSSAKSKPAEKSKLLPQSINVADCIGGIKMLGYAKNNVDTNNVRSKPNFIERQTLSNGDVGKKPGKPSETSIELIEKPFTFADNESASHSLNENELSRRQSGSSGSIIPGNFSFVDDASNSSKNHNEQPKENLHGKECLDSHLGINTKYNKVIPNIVVPGDYDFIDDKNVSSLSINHSQKKDSIDSNSIHSYASGSDAVSDNMASDNKISFAKLEHFPRSDSTGAMSKCMKNIPSVVIPGNFHFIDDPIISSISRERSPSRSSTDSLVKNSNVNGESAANKSIDDCTLPSNQVSETLPSKDSASSLKEIPCVVIQGNFNFIDDPSISSISRERLNSKISTDSEFKDLNENKANAMPGSTEKDSTSFDSTSKMLQPNNSVRTNRPQEIPSVVIPGNFNFIDDPSISLVSRERLSSKSSANSGRKNSNEIEGSGAFKSVDDYSTCSGHTSNILLPNNSEQVYRSKEIPSIVIPGDFNFIDEMNASSLSLKGKSFINGRNKQLTPECYSPCKSSKSETFISPTPAPSSQMIFKIPSIYLPSNVQYIDDSINSPNGRKLSRGERVHSSFKIPRNHSTKRRLCRYHSDSETKTSGEVKNPKPKHHRSRSKKVKRSVSAIETNKDNYRTSVRRSYSDRSGMIAKGNHLRPPGTRYRPHSYHEGEGSSRCSSTKTLSTNVSISEIVAVEMGLMDIPGLTAKEARRRRVVCTVAVVAVTIAIVCVLLVAVTLFLSPEIDAVLRKGNEEIYRSMAAGASTSSPTTEESAAVVANNSAPPPSGSPG